VDLGGASRGHALAAGVHPPAVHPTAHLDLDDRADGVRVGARLSQRQHQPVVLATDAQIGSSTSMWNRKMENIPRLKKRDG
jgi:hypothetical protein